MHSLPPNPVETLQRAFRSNQRVALLEAPDADGSLLITEALQAADSRVCFAKVEAADLGNVDAEGRICSALAVIHGGSAKSHVRAALRALDAFAGEVPVAVIIKGLQLCSTPESLGRIKELVGDVRVARLFFVLDSEQLAGELFGSPHGLFFQQARVVDCPSFSAAD